MELNIDRLRQFIGTIKTIGFWRRLFCWGTVKTQLVDAVADLQKLLTSQEGAIDQLQQQRQQVSDLTKDLTIARNGEASKMQAVDDLTQRKQEMERELAIARNVLETVGRELQQGKEMVLDFESKEERRQSDYAKQAATLNAIQEKIQADREKEEKAAQALEIQRLADLRFTWSNHQLTVKQVIKVLCQKHTIEYIATAPFKGDPDNTVKIAGELVIFDAKSPRGDDLTNFPSYLKEQAEKVKKYAGEENVKKWVFFVVPENTLSRIGTYVYHLADYQVFIVATNSLEPILLSLKKVEEYEFADQLSPEDRENICRILGKFAHLSKRRIQIDTYFIGQFMELARKCENDLPAEILDDAIEFEKAEKLNPPLEKRAKAIPMVELEKATGRAIADAANQGILAAGEQLTTSLNAVPLYYDNTSQM